mgnify:CR=1 FL=1
MNSNPKAGKPFTQHASQDKPIKQHDYHRVEPRSHQPSNEPPELIAATLKGEISTTLASQMNSERAPEHPSPMHDHHRVEPNNSNNNPSKLTEANTDGVENTCHRAEPTCDQPEDDLSWLTEANAIQEEGTNAITQESPESATAPSMAATRIASCTTIPAVRELLRASRTIATNQVPADIDSTSTEPTLINTEQVTGNSQSRTKDDAPSQHQASSNILASRAPLKH